MIGSLMWAALCKQPNIAFAVNSLAQFNLSFGPEHIARVKQNFRYLKGTINYDIQYSQSNSGTMTIGYADADWAEDKDWKSISGNVFIMSGGAIAWSAKKQGTIALSTLEAEYVALSHATRHILWHQMLIWELRLEPDRPFNLNNDNHRAIALTRDSQFHGQSKHIDIHHHFLRELIEHGDLQISHIQSENNIADIFTKPLTQTLFRNFPLFSCSICD